MSFGIIEGSSTSKAKTPITYSYYSLLSLQLWPNTPIIYIPNLEVIDSVPNSKFIP